MPITVPRTIYYRHAHFLTPQLLTLEDMLRSALAKTPAAHQRARDLGDKVNQVLNHHQVVGNTVCGAVYRWVEGQDQMALERDPKAPFWKVLPVRPPAGATAAQKREFIEAMVYFGVRGNHLVVMQSKILRADELSDFLSWYFRDCVPGTLAKEDQISLLPASPAKMRAAGLQKAKSISVRADLADTISKPPPAGGRRKTPIYQKVLKKNLAASLGDVLKALDLKLPARILESGEAKDLELVLEVRRPYGRDELGNTVMTELGKLAGQMESTNYKVTFLDGSELSGDELNLHRSIRINLPAEGGHPHPADVFAKIDAYLHQLLQEGAV